jgi:hypothetical protein
VNATAPIESRDRDDHKPSTGQTSQDGNNINRKLSQRRRRRLFLFSDEHRETRTIRFYWAHSRWLTQFALGRADNAISSSSSPVVVSAQCFLRNFQRDKRMPMSFFLSSLRVSSLLGLDFSVALPHVSRLILAYSTI